MSKSICRTLAASALLVLGSIAAAQGDASITMKVDGLVCAFCAQGIEKKLTGFAATDGVHVDLEHGRVALGLKPGQDISDADLRSALTNAGYTVTAISRSAEPLAAIKSARAP